MRIHSTTPRHRGRAGLSREVLRQAVLDAKALRDAGAWEQARACCLATHRAQRDDIAAADFLPALAVDLLARELADLLGANRELCQSIAREALLPSRAGVMAAELRAQAAALSDPSPALSTRSDQQPSSSIVVRRGGRRHGR